MAHPDRCIACDATPAETVYRLSGRGLVICARCAAELPEPAATVRLGALRDLIERIRVRRGHLQPDAS